ncbi:MAG: glycosyltransferase [Deltaproteobacteria bacterium]|nr:MAG: glycosyltransferase [Deltaproteobacteria bacterium]
MRGKVRENGNILLVANYESGVGFAWWLMENFWVEIARYFSGKGRKVFLMYPIITSIPKNILSAPVTILNHDFSDRSFIGKRGLKNIIAVNGIKSIYLTDRPYWDVYYLLLRKWGVENIVLHDHTPGERPKSPAYKRMIKKFIYMLGVLSCDLYIGVSRFVYERFIATGCLPHRKCRYVLNGIVPIDLDQRYRFYAHDEFNIPRDARIIISTGRATKYKGIDFILKCADKIINGLNEKKVFFLHCGAGPDLMMFRKMACDYGIENNFIFAGMRDDIPKLLQSCDIGIQASLGEAFSLSILEYMSAGLAAVVPDNCGNGEAITTGLNGMLYKPGDLEEATNILNNLIHDEDKIKYLGSNATISVREKFNIKRTNEELIQLLSEHL